MCHVVGGPHVAGNGIGFAIALHLLSVLRLATGQGTPGQHVRCELFEVDAPLGLVLEQPIHLGDLDGSQLSGTGRGR